MINLPAGQRFQLHPLSLLKRQVKSLDQQLSSSNYILQLTSLGGHEKGTVLLEPPPPLPPPCPLPNLL